MKNLPELLKEFDEGCNIDNISDPPSDKKWIKSFISKVYTHAVENCLDVLPKKKGQLDQSDPDNYEACYAIGGFNNAAHIAEQNIKNLLVQENCKTFITNHPPHQIG